MQGTLRDLFTIELSEPANTQASVPKAAAVPSTDEVQTEEESQEEPVETTADSTEVSGAKTGGGKCSQTLLEQV